MVLLSSALAAAAPHVSKTATAAPRVMGKTPATQMAAAGEGALITVLVEGKRFSGMRRYLRLLDRAISPRPRRRLAGALRAKRLWSLLGGMLLGKRTSLRASWEHVSWDRSRPLVFGLFEVDPARAIFARLALSPPWRLRMTRHRVLIPLMKDPTSLLAALRGLGESMGMEKKRHSSKALWMQAQAWSLAAVVEADHVRVELAEVERGSEAVALLMRHLGRPPLSGPAPKTPARAAMEGAKAAFVRAYVRPWLVAELAFQHGFRSVHRALRGGALGVTSRERRKLYAMGLSELLSTLMLLDARGAELDDFALVLRTKPHLVAVALGSLTKQGQQVFDAGQATAHRAFVVRGKAIVKATATVGLKAMLKKAIVPPVLEGARARLLRSALQVGGTLGAFGMLSRRPFGLGRAIQGLFPVVLRDLSVGALGVVVDVNPNQRFGWHRGGVVSFEPGWPKAQLSQLPDFRRPGTLRPRSRRGGNVAVALGDFPRFERAFGDARRARPPLAQAVLDFRRFAVEFPQPLRAILARLRVARFELRRCSPASLALGFALGKGGRMPKVTVPKVRRWLSPGLARAQSVGGRCLFEMTQAVQRALVVRRGAAPATRGKQLYQARRRAGKYLSCAAGDPATQREARLLQEALALHEAERLFWARDEALRVLRQACRKGLKGACARSKEVERLPRIKLACAKGGQPLPMFSTRSMTPAVVAAKGALPSMSRYRVGVDARTSYGRLQGWIKGVAGSRFLFAFTESRTHAWREVSVKITPPSTRAGPRRAEATLARDSLVLKHKHKRYKIGGLLWSGSESDLEHLRRVARKLEDDGARTIAFDASAALTWADVLPVIVALDAGGLEVYF